MSNNKQIYKEILITSTEEKLLVQRYLSCEWTDGIHNYKSSYYAALLEARKHAGRNTLTGKIEDEEKTGCWSGACTYMTLIDHVGGFFADGVNKDNRESFMGCLEKFSYLKEKIDFDTIYSLRNSFIHKFNLYNDNKKYNNSHIFSVNRDPINLIIKAKMPWDGIYKKEGIDSEYITSVSLRRLGDMVEDIHLNLLKKISNNELKITIPEELDLESFLNLNTIRYIPSK